MSSPVAIGLALLLWLAVSAPAVLAFRSARAATLVAPLYVAALIGLAVYHVRLPGAGVAGTADRWKAANRKSTEAIGGGSSALCARILREAERGRLIVGRGRDGRVTVSRDLWAQLPEQVQQAITDCLESERPDGDTGSIEIVQS